MTALIAVMAIAIAAAAGQKPAAPPGDRATLIARAEAELKAGRRAEAIRLLTSAAERFQSVRALLQLARLQSSGGETAASLATLRRARELAPNSEEVLSAFAQVSLASRMLLPAVRTLEPLTRMCPTVAQYHYMLGVALISAGDVTSAIPAFEEARRLEPEAPRSLLGLGLALNAGKRHTEAKPLLVRALELDPENVDAAAALAEAEEGGGDLVAAEALARRALGRAPAHPQANLVLGTVLMAHEKYADARDALQRAVASAPDLPKAHYQLSLAYARLGDSLNAKRQVDLYQQALRAIEANLKALNRGQSRTGSPQ